MSDAHDQILKMLEEGKITAEEADKLLTAMRDDPNREPIIVDVDDEDGDKVEIYIG
jgi:hypothetical protein